ncbi:MAG TPA: DUF1015 family protein [Acidimicrobiia bacterium]|nr:DUF1015 family protein [Acidimicrobiia bacterium]
MNGWLLPVDAGLVRSDLAREVISPAYDLLTDEQRRLHAIRHPLSFLHGTPASETDDPVDDAGARREQALEYIRARWAEDTWVFRAEAFYVYRIQSGGHLQTGVVGDVPASAFPLVIRPHENTRPARVADLVDYLNKVAVGSSPVGLTYRRQPEIDAMVALITHEPPDLDIVLEDGDRQTIWTVTDREVLEGLRAAFADVPAAYIVDGHHRVAATLERGTDPGTPAGRFLAVAIPDDDLTVYPFHRWLESDWRPELAPIPQSDPRPGVVVAVAKEGEWELELRSEGDDATALASQVLCPRLGVEDERTDPRLVFIPGYPGPERMRGHVQTAGGIGFLLHPPTVAAVMAVSDRGGVMPPKATFFFPKPRSGVFVVNR